MKGWPGYKKMPDSAKNGRVGENGVRTFSTFLPVMFWLLFNLLQAKPSEQFHSLFTTINHCAIQNNIESCEHFRKLSRFLKNHWPDYNKYMPEKASMRRLARRAQFYVIHNSDVSYREEFLFQSLVLEGAYAVENHQYKMAANALIRAEHTSRNVNWPFYHAMLHNNLGILYYSELAFEKAEEHFQAALRNIIHSRENLNDWHWGQNILNNWGLSLGMQNKKAEARTAFRIAMRISQYSGNLSGVAFAQINLFHSYIQFDEPCESWDEIDEVLKITRDADDRLYGRAAVVGAMLYKKAGNKDAAFAVLRTLEPERHLRDYDSYRLSYYKMLAEYEASRKNYKEAYRLAALQRQTTDSLIAVRRGKLAQIESVRQNILAQTQMAEDLKEDLELKEMEARIYFAFGTLLFVVMLIISGLWISLRKRFAKYLAVSDGLKRKNLQLHRTNRHLEVSNKHKSYILSTVAHDLRNVLGNVTQVSELLLGVPEGKLYAPENMKLLAMLGSSAQNGLYTLQDLSDAIRPGSQISMNWGMMLPEVIIHEVDNLLFAKLRRKRIQLEVDNRSGLLLACDRDKAIRALTNLVDNAIKFSEPGGKIKISVYDSRDGGIIFRVRDFGKGIASEARHKLFHPFSPGVQGTLGEPSSGLGLFIVRRIMRAHGGSVHVKTKIGRGTSFYLYFPAPSSSVGA